MIRLATTTLAALGAAVLAAAPAFADFDLPHPNLPRPHVTVQIGSPAPVYVQPQYGYQNGYRYQQPGYGYQQPGAYGGGPAWQNPQVYRQRVEGRMSGIRNDLQERIQRGAVSPQAISEFENRQRDIMGDVNAAANDGVISQDERQHINEDVDSLRFLEQRYRTNVQPAYGGGPGYYHYHQGW